MGILANVAAAAASSSIDEVHYFAHHMCVCVCEWMSTWIEFPPSMLHLDGVTFQVKIAAKLIIIHAGTIRGNTWGSMFGILFSRTRTWLSGRHGRAILSCVHFGLN